MQTIIYKSILGRYEISDVTSSTGDGIRVLFDTPLDGHLTIGATVYPIARGVCKIPSTRLSDGEVLPRLVSGGAVKNLEGFTVTRGAVIRRSPDEEYSRRLAEAVDSLAKRISAIEAEIDTVRDKISQKLSF